MWFMHILLSWIEMTKDELKELERVIQRAVRKEVKRQLKKH